MKKYRTFLTLLALLLAVPLGARSQETLTVCDGTNVNTYVPLYSYYSDTDHETQIVYPADSLDAMVGGTINSLTFYYNSTSFNSGNISVRLGTTENFTGYTSYYGPLITTGLGDPLYSGSFTLASDHTITITLTTPFEYEGGDLVVDVNFTSSTSSYGSSSDGFYGATSTVYRTVCSYYDYYDYEDVFNVSYTLPKCTFDYTTGGEPTCKKPGNLRLMDIASNSAYLKWNAPNSTNALDVTSYGFEYGLAAGFVPGAGTAGSCDTLGAILENLEPGTAYTFRVWTICGSSESADTLSLNFTTRNLPATVPYVTGFEEGDDVAWEFANDDDNQWVIGTAANNGGSNGLYISNDNGATNTYTSQSNNSYAYRDILVEEAGDYALSFDWRCVGETTQWDYMAVYLAPASAADPVAGSASLNGWNQIGYDYFFNQESWTTFQTVIDTLQPGTYKLIFRWRDDSSTENDPPAGVDNISFVKLSCPQPTALHFDTAATTTTSLTIAWTAGGDESAWVYRVNGTGEWTPISENPYTISDLTPGTLYNIELRAFCEEGDTSFSTTASLFTACAPVEQLPFEPDFTAMGNARFTHPCWGKGSSSSNYPLVSETSGLTLYSYYYSSSWSTSTDSTYVILPELSEDIALNTLELVVNAKKYNSSTSTGNLIVAAIDSNFYNGTTTPIDIIGTINVNSTDDFSLYAQSLTGYTGEKRRIMLLAPMPTSGYGTIYIHDLSLHTAPLCDHPDSVVVSAVTYNSATITVHDPAELNNYHVVVMAGEEEIYNETVNTNVINVDELAPATLYRVTAASVCGDGNETMTVSTSFNTECVPIIEVDEENSFVENFNGITSGIPQCWDNSEGTTTDDSRKWNSYSSGHEGRGLRFDSYYNTSGNTNFLKMPTLQLNADMSLSFWYKNPMGGDFTIYVATVGETGTEERTAIASSLPNTDNWTFRIIPLNEYTEQQVTIIFKGTSNYGSDDAYIYLDDISVIPSPDCSMPTGVSVNNITAHTANIVVNDANEEPNYTVLVYSGTDTVINRLPFTTTTIPVEGLHPDSLYNVSVIANCESSSYPAVTTSFRTFCEGIDELPWSESFESHTASNNGFSAPCWSVMGAYQTYDYSSYYYDLITYPKIATDMAFDGTKSLLLSSGSKPQVVVLPPFETSVNELMLTLAQFTSDEDYMVEVGVMTNPADTSTFRLAQACTPSSTNAWETHSVTFSGMPDGVIAIRFSGYDVYIDSIVVEERPACTRPNSVAVSDITTNSATLTIADAGNIGNYVYKLYMNDTVFIDSLACQSEVSLTDLLSDTPYKVFAYTLCSDGNPTDDYTIATFRTACAAEEFPFHFNPEDLLAIMNDGFSPCWSYTSFYRSTSNGVGYVYSSTAGSRFILPTVDADLSEAQFRAHVATGSSNGEYFFRVGVLEANDEVTWLDTIPVTRTASTTAGEEYIVLLSNYTGTGNRIVVGNINNNYVYFLDFHVEEPDVCTKVTDIVASDTTTSGITLSWTSDASQWVVFLDGEEVATVDQSTYTFQGLASSSTFTATIRALCGDDTARAANYTFSTLCGVATVSETTSFSQNFNGITAGIPQCWDNSEGTTTTDSYKWNYYATGHEGSGLRFNSYSNSNGNTNFLATPELAIEVPAQLAFWYKNPNGGDFSVFYSTDGGTTKTQIASGLTGASNWTLAEYTLPDTLVNQTINIYFKGTSNYGYDDAYIYLDEVVVEKAPSCTAPTIALGEVTTTSAVITLSDANNVNHYQLYVDNDATGIEVTGTTYTIQNLSPASSHSVYAKTLCESGDTTRASATLSFNTECNVIATLPWSENFDNATSDVMPACWDVFFNGSSASSAPHVGTSSYQTDLSGKWLYFAASNSSTSSYGNPQMAILPPFEAAINTLTMTFRYEYESASYGTLEVGYVTGADFNTDFVAVKTCTVNTDGTDDTVSFATAPAEAERIAFRWTNNYSTYYTAGVDNIVVDLNGGDVPPVGIEDVETADIVLFPNPATSNVTLRGVEAGSQVSMVDMNGRMVRDFKAANDNVRIDVSNLAKGAYFVRVVNGNTNAIRKLIVK